MQIETKDQFEAGLFWILVPFVAILGWYGTVFFGILLVTVINSFCPPKEFLSGMCIASWYNPTMDALTVFCAGLCAFVILVGVVLTAPSHRVIVAKITYVLGGLIAFFMAYTMSAWGSFFAAVAFGGIALFGLSRRQSAWHNQRTQLTAKTLRVSSAADA